MTTKTVLKEKKAEIKKSSWFWIKDTKGYQSVTLTFATITFVITTIAYASSIFEHIGPVTFRQFDVGACGAYFGTIMALYWGRKWTEAKYANNSGNNEQ